jgi:hypothetical protein
MATENDHELYRKGATEAKQFKKKSRAAFNSPAGDPN